MYYKEHEPAYFHAEYAGQPATFAFDGGLIAGETQDLSRTRRFLERGLNPMAERNTQSSRTDLRMLVGFALVPPMAVLITLVTYELMFQARLLPQGAPIDSLDSAESLGTGAAILAVLVTLFGAVPAVISLKNRGLLSLGRLLILGGGLGNLPFALIMVGVVAHAMSGTPSADIGRYWYGFSGAAIGVALGLIGGTGSAAAFWFIVGMRDGSVICRSTVVRRRRHAGVIAGYGNMHGETDVVRVKEYTPLPLTFGNRLKSRLASLKRRINARSRPTGEENARTLRERGESLDSISFRDAVAADIAELAELHVTTWNATYNTARGPTIATRTWQWNQVFAKESRRDFVLVLEDRNGRLIGFTWGRPHEGEFEGELSKIYLRWEYHGLGLGRRMMAETARRFLERGIHSFVLFAELSNPTLGFYDRMGGERLLDDRGHFGGAYAWRDLRTLIR